jgi:plasmid stabilization system protein ParE
MPAVFLVKKSSLNAKPTKENILRTIDYRQGAVFAESKCEICVSRNQEEQIMPRGDKGAYTDKQKRKAEHIEEGYEKKGVSEKEAAARAWATVNKESGGGKKSGSGRGKKENRSASKKGGKKAGKKAAAKKTTGKAAKKSTRKSSKK